MTIYLVDTLKLAKKEEKKLVFLTNDEICNILLKVAKAIQDNIPNIVKSNQIDLKNFELQNSKEHANYDRLLLNEDRIKLAIEGIKEVIKFNFNTDDNLICKYTQPSGIEINKISAPLGTICLIYESRPNVTIDVFALCFRTQNVCILKGGKEAINTNTTIVYIIKDVLKKYNLQNAIQLLNIDRTNMKFLLEQDKYIDVCIPRGGKNLIKYVKENSKIPIIETGAGVVHLYIDKNYDLEICKKVVENAKLRRVSVCNALDCVVVHKEVIKDLPLILQPIFEKNVEIFADSDCFDVIKNYYQNVKFTTNDDNKYGTEFLDYKMLIISVKNYEEAINFISTYTSHHSECIISNDEKVIKDFSNIIDASSIFVNTSTAFADGKEFGIGAEIGISTQKLHARGPIGIQALRTTKNIVFSNGAVRK